MKVIIGTEEEIAKKAAQQYVELLKRKPNAVLGGATGSTPLGLYAELARLNKEGVISFKDVTTFNLDEYVGLDGSHDQSYRYFMDRHFFDHINIDRANTFVPDGLAPDAAAECSRYDALIRRLGGIDLQLLGLGHNGHIGFNEPDEVFTKGTHMVTLSESTLRANRRFFEREEDVPRFACTVGICDIMQARRIVMVVSGADKADIIREAFFGPVTPHVPASILQLHRDFTLVADEEALIKV